MKTTPDAPARRPLSFSGLDEILPDVDRLLAGHVAVGNWTLGQNCDHLATTFRYSVEGFPFQLPWAVRRLVGPLAFRWFDRSGRLPAGVKAPAPLAPRPAVDDREGAESLRAAIALYRERGPIREHPIMGPFTPAKWERIHAIHAAHHLSFLLPREPSRA